MERGREIYINNLEVDNKNNIFDFIVLFLSLEPIFFCHYPLIKISIQLLYQTQIGGLRSGSMSPKRNKVKLGEKTLLIDMNFIFICLRGGLYHWGMRSRIHRCIISLISTQSPYIMHFLNFLYVWAILYTLTCC